MNFKEMQKYLLDIYSKDGYEKVVVDNENTWMLKNENIKDAYLSLTKDDALFRIELFNIPLRFNKDVINNAYVVERPKITPKTISNMENLGFQWWIIWAWINLVVGNLYMIFELHLSLLLTIFFVAVNTILMIFVLKYNKYAFLIATVLSLNLLLWIINGIYLKNRWNHSKVNLKKTFGSKIKKLDNYLQNVKLNKSENNLKKKEDAREFKKDDYLEDLQNLINKAVAKGDSKTAQELLKILKKQKKEIKLKQRKN